MAERMRAMMESDGDRLTDVDALTAVDPLLNAISLTFELFLVRGCPSSCAINATVSTDATSPSEQPRRRLAFRTESALGRALIVFVPRPTVFAFPYLHN